MKLKILTIFFTFLLTTCLSSTINGQDAQIGMPGAAKTVYQEWGESGDRNCFVYGKYVVKTQPAEDNGSDIFVFERDKNRSFKEICGDAESKPAMTFKDDSQFFVGLSDEKIFIDSGTSAGERGLKIIDLAARKIAYSTSYYNQPEIAGNNLLYDKPSDKKGLLKNCKDWREWRKSGGGIGWVQPVRLDLKTFGETPVGNLKCVYLE